MADKHEGRKPRRQFLLRRNPEYLVPIFLGFMFACGTSVYVNEGVLDYTGGALYIMMVLFVLLFCVAFKYGYAFLAKFQASRPFSLRMGKRAVKADGPASGETVSASDAEGSATATSAPPETSAASATVVVAEPTAAMAAAKGDTAFDARAVRTRRPRTTFGTWLRHIFLSDDTPLFRWNACSVLLMTLIIFLCWMPWVLSMFPGVYWCDTQDEIMWMLQPQETALSAHHPLTVTMLLWAFADLGLDVLGGNMFRGLFVLILLQDALAALSCSLMVAYLVRLRVRRMVRLVVFLFFALFPAIPWFMASLVKDTLSIPFFVMFSIAYAEIIRTRGGCLRSSKVWVVLLIVSAICVSLTKKPTLYVVVISLVVAFLVTRRGSTRVLLAGTALATYLIVNMIVPAAVSAGVGRTILPDGRQEILAVPLQQLGNVVVNDPTVIDAEGRAIIDDTYLMGFEHIPDDYTWDAADGVKGYVEAPNARYGDFLELWAETGLRKPVAYFTAWTGLVDNWFTFATGPNLAYGFDSQHSLEGFLQLPRNWQYTLFDEQVTALSDALMTVPVVDLLMMKSFWASILPAFCLFGAWRTRDGDRRQRFGMMIPMLFSVAVLLVGPVSLWNESVRYVMPLVLTAPLNMLLAFSPRAHIDVRFESEAAEVVPA